MAHPLRQNKEKELEIRPHHLLCLLGFQGLGYSPEFVENMGLVKQRIFANPQLPLKLVSRVDIICARCPHRKNNQCQKEQDPTKVKKRDSQVLKKLNLKAGSVLSSGTLYSSLKEKIIPSDMLEICQGCEWLPLGLCLKGLEEL